MVVPLGLEASLARASSSGAALAGMMVAPVPMAIPTATMRETRKKRSFVISRSPWLRSARIRPCNRAPTTRGDQGEVEQYQVLQRQFHELVILGAPLP